MNSIQVVKLILRETQNCTNIFKSSSGHTCTAGQLLKFIYFLTSLRNFILTKLVVLFRQHCQSPVLLKHSTTSVTLSCSNNHATKVNVEVEG